MLYAYIEDIHNPPEDGHCGFHGLAKALEGKWDHIGVRKAMGQELSEHMDHYELLFGQEDARRLSVALRVSGKGPVGQDKWLVAPDMLIIAANAFGRCCILYSSDSSVTCPPSRVSPSKSTSNTPLLLAFVNGNHFVVPILSCATSQVIPYPPLYKLYTRDHKRVWVAWNDYLRGNLRIWESKVYSLNPKRVRVL